MSGCGADNPDHQAGHDSEGSGGRSGALLWQSEFGGAALYGLAYDVGTVFFGTNYGAYYALDASTGKKRWQAAVGGPRATR